MALKTISTTVPADVKAEAAAAVKSLAFRLPDARYVIVGMRAKARTGYKRIADALGVRRAGLRGASAEQLETALDMQPGVLSRYPGRVTGRSSRRLRKVPQGFARQPVPCPFIQWYRAQPLVELNRRFIPIQHGPLQPPAVPHPRH